MKEFIKLVREMRTSQKNYFAGRLTVEGRTWLIKSKELEKEVDTMLIQMENEKETINKIKE